MRNTMLILSLLLTANALGERWDIQPHKPFVAVQSPRKAKALRDARAAYTLSDGSQWITHSVPAQREPSAIGVTRFGVDGSARVFLVSDWLPKGTIPRGSCGQVYGVALLTDGRVAISAGWTDGHASHNGIFILRATEDRDYAVDKLIEVPGVAQIAGAPRNTILAVTDDATLRGGGPLLTLFDTQGRRLGTLFDKHLPISASEAARNAINARLQRINERGFALYDPSEAQVHVFDVDVLESGNEAIVTPRRGIFVGDDASTANLPVLAIDARDDGDLLVARAGLMSGAPGTRLTIYGRDGAPKQSATLDRPWNLTIRENGQLRGVLLRHDVVLDSAVMRHEK